MCDIFPLINNVIDQCSDNKFALDRICEFFGASAGTFWIKDIDTDEFEAIELHNRPDVVDLHEYSFSVSEDSEDYLHATSLVFQTGKPCVANIGEYPFDVTWKKKGIVSDIKDFKKIAILPIFSASNTPVASISLYSDEFADCINQQELIQKFLDFLGHLIVGPATFGYRLVSERRKIGHEIRRQLRNISSKIQDTQTELSDLGSSKSVNSARRNLRDLNILVSTSANSVSEEKFVEGVIKRKRKASPTDLKKLHDAVSSSFSSSGGSRRFPPIAFDFEFVKVHINRSDLDLIFSNLMENAMKYSSPGGIVLTRLLRDGNKLEYTIRNISEKIPNSELKNAWIYGRRLSNAQEQDGDGIGMSIVSDICRVYGLERNFLQYASHSDSNLTWSVISIAFPTELATFRGL